MPEREGCYLQGAIPHTAASGMPGRYATDPAERLIEGSLADPLRTRRHLEADWDRWFEPGGAWRIEKSPVNLVRARLYQQLFPTAQFVFILRHPRAMAGALAKWCDRPADALMRYAVEAYEIALSDARFLHAALILRYEDLVRAPARLLEAVFAFLALDPIRPAFAVRDGNADYSDAPPVPPVLLPRFARFGYGDHLRPVAPFGSVAHPLRDRRDAVEALLLA